MDKETYATIPKTLTLRELKVRVEVRGFRVRQLVVVTTRTDAQLSPLAVCLPVSSATGSRLPENRRRSASSVRQRGASMERVCDLSELSGSGRFLPREDPSPSPSPATA
jgi:hypothetical protein